MPLRRSRHPAAKLRSMLRQDGGGIIVAPGVFDGISAHMAVRSGHRALYVTGAGSSASLLGRADLGFLGLGDILHVAGVAVEVGRGGHHYAAEGQHDDEQHDGNYEEDHIVPVVADADTGFGGAPQIARTVTAYYSAGVAGLHIEDQVQTKRCGHLDSKQLVSCDEFVARIRAAARARDACCAGGGRLGGAARARRGAGGEDAERVRGGRGQVGAGVGDQARGATHGSRKESEGEEAGEEDDERIVVIARTDAVAGHGVDEAVRRMRLARAAGADMGFVEGLRSDEEARRVVQLLSKDDDGGGWPLLANCVTGGKSPLWTAQDVERLGFKLAIFPCAGMFAAMSALEHSYMHLLRRGIGAEASEPARSAAASSSSSSREGGLAPVSWLGYGGGGLRRFFANMGLEEELRVDREAQQEALDGEARGKTGALGAV